MMADARYGAFHPAQGHATLQGVVPTDGFEPSTS